MALGILFALAIPAFIRELRRRQMLASARSGDAAAAWLAVQDAAIDLGIDVPASETPRTLGTRLVEQHGAPAGRDEPARSARSSAPSYAPGGKHAFWQGDAIADAATTVRAAMLGLGRHAAPPAGAARAAIAHRAPGQRLRRFGSDRARKVGWSAAREGHGGFA